MHELQTAYESPAITVLGRECGLAEVIGFDRHRMIPLSADAWREVELAPVPFLAVDANGGDVVYTAAGDTLAGRVLLTGYQSGKVWSRRETEPDDYDIARPDQSGLSLSEFRLWVGFLHFPVPFMAIRQVADINALGRPAEMAAWDVGRSGCRCSSARRTSFGWAASERITSSG